MTSITEGYRVIMDLGDPTVKDWPFMSEPWTILGIAAAYLYVVYIYFPNYMANRKPYSLKSFIAAYNIFQVIACGLLVYGVLTSTTAEFGCPAMDKLENKKSTRLATVFWWHFMIKLVDLIETFVFILRNKNNQVTVLHVFHHVSTFIMAWLTVNFSPTSMFTLPVIFNSSVHVLMYAYYYLSSLGPAVQKKLTFIKSKITIIQIIQLVAIVSQQCVLLQCKSAPFMLPLISISVITVDIVLFLNFYVQNYLRKNKQS